jgi:hypothetical protein
MTTRARKEKFIRGFGSNAAKNAVLTLFYRYGLDMLTDEQLAEVTFDLVQDWRSASKRNAENRAINAARIDQLNRRNVA